MVSQRAHWGKLLQNRYEQGHAEGVDGYEDYNAQGYGYGGHGGGSSSPDESVSGSGTDSGVNANGTRLMSSRHSNGSTRGGKKRKSGG